jgi:hypothetical protein
MRKLKTMASFKYPSNFQTWYLYYGTGLEPKVNFTLWTLLLVMFGLGLAIGVVLAVGALLFFQVGRFSFVMAIKK